MGDKEAEAWREEKEASAEAMKSATIRNESQTELNKAQTSALNRINWAMYALGIGSIITGIDNNPKHTQHLSLIHI